MSTVTSRDRTPRDDQGDEGVEGLPSYQGGEDSAPPPPRRSLTAVASELWHQKPGARTKEPKPLPANTAEIVNGLDPREVRFGLILAVLDLALTLIVYFYWRHSHTVRVRNYAPDFLVAGLIGSAMLAGGIGFRRRALLGFAAFLVGMEMISFGLIYGILYLFFGGWLIVRVMRKQKQDQAAGRYTGTVDTGPRGSRASRGSGIPSASKRYTPPRRAAGRSAASARRR